jgi:hypothetical protein
VGGNPISYSVTSTGVITIRAPWNITEDRYMMDIFKQMVKFGSTENFTAIVSAVEKLDETEQSCTIGDVAVYNQGGPVIRINK